MYAIRPDLVPRYPTPAQPPKRRIKRRSSQRHQVRQRQRYVLALGTECLAKLLVNVLLLSAFSSALIRLVPYAWEQHTKLRSIQEEVALSERQVQELELHFSQAFDPKQAKAIMKEQSYLVDPNQKRIIWQED